MILMPNRPLNEIISLSLDLGRKCACVFISQANNPPIHGAASDLATVPGVDLVLRDHPERNRVVALYKRKDVVPEIGLSDEHV